MTEKELLELAAKAAGIEGRRFVENEAIQANLHTGMWCDLLEDIWNPLTDDGDALRLAVKLGLLVDVWLQQKVCIASNQGEELVDARVEFGTDPQAATRRAIVRAAAEIGKALK